MAGIPIIINTIHGLYFDDNSSLLKKRIFIVIEKISARCSDLIFSVNRKDMAVLVKEKISGPEKIMYLGNGINTDKFNLERFPAEFIAKKKEELKIPSGFKIVGIVARMVKEKGYLELFAAFKKIIEKFPDVVLLVVGETDFEKKDKINPAIAEDFNIAKNTIFLGERNDVAEIYPLMDIFVLPSHREGLPVSVLEAMAEKRPVVASDIRGCREEINSGINGILVPPKNPAKLAEAIIFLLENKQKANQMASEARIKVKKEFDEKLVFDRMEKEYKRLIAEKTK
jgi:glycosyltransferase involved in cell wall biosynthesis